MNKKEVYGVSERIIDRLAIVVAAMHTNETQVCMKSGISIGNFAYVRKNDTDLSRRNAERFLSAYPEVNPSWFLTGAGEMFVNKGHDSLNDVKYTSSIDTNSDSIVVLRETIRFQQTLIASQQETIKELVSLLQGEKH